MKKTNIIVICAISNFNVYEWIISCINKTNSSTRSYQTGLETPQCPQLKYYSCLIASFYPTFQTELSRLPPLVVEEVSKKLFKLCDLQVTRSNGIPNSESAVNQVNSRD